MARCAGFAWMRPRRRTKVARCSSADRITSSRRRLRTSISVIARSLQPLVQRLLVALQHGDRLLEERVALLRRDDDVAHAARAHEQEGRREAGEDQRAVLLRGPEGEREDGEQDAEGEEVE